MRTPATRACVLAIALVACDSKDAAPAKAAPVSSDAKPNEDDPRPAVAGDAPSTRLEASASSGQSLSTQPTRCSIADNGNVSIEADGGNFVLTSEGGVGRIQWKSGDMTLDQETAITVSGKTVVTSGTFDGGGYNAEVTCG